MKSLLFLIVLLVSTAAYCQPQIVDYTKLEKFLPEKTFGGYQRGKPVGETSSMMGFSTSWALVTYTLPPDSSEIQLSVKITDMLNIPSLSMPLPNINRQTSDGYEKTVVYKGIRVLETCDSTDRQEKLQFPLAGRFLVEISGKGTQDISELYGLLDITDLSGLKKLK